MIGQIYMYNRGQKTLGHLRKDYAFIKSFEGKNYCYFGLKKKKEKEISSHSFPGGKIKKMQ